MCHKCLVTLSARFILKNETFINHVIKSFVGADKSFDWGNLTFQVNWIFVRESLYQYYRIFSLSASTFSTEESFSTFLGDCISLEIFWWKGCTRVIPIASSQMLNQSAWSPSLDPPPPSTGLAWRACLFSFLKKRNPPSLACAAHEMGHQGRSHLAARGGGGIGSSLPFSHFQPLLQAS